MRARPLGDRVVVEPIYAPERTSPGGVIFPDDVIRWEVPTLCRITALGTGKVSRRTGRRYLSVDVRVGDLVLVGKFRGTPLDPHDELAQGPKIVDCEDLLCVVEGVES